MAQSRTLKARRRGPPANLLLPSETSGVTGSGDPSLGPAAWVLTPPAGPHCFPTAMLGALTIFLLFCQLPT